MCEVNVFDTRNNKQSPANASELAYVSQRKINVRLLGLYMMWGGERD